MEAYNIYESLDEFSAARAHFKLLIDCLSSEETATATHGDVENLIKDEGFEVLRRLLQGYLDLRAVRETPLDAVGGKDDVLRRVQFPRVDTKARSYYDIQFWSRDVA
ncbi:MAG: hypothetical protein JXR76_01960 [Deltaproteobacteria bacterium]|nr:hypothetical protein [Deltaproteobacteria bacterium]